MGKGDGIGESDIGAFRRGMRDGVAFFCIDDTRTSFPGVGFERGFETWKHIILEHRLAFLQP